MKHLPKPYDTNPAYPYSSLQEIVRYEYQANMSIGAMCNLFPAEVSPREWVWVYQDLDPNCPFRPWDHAIFGSNT